MKATVRPPRPAPPRPLLCILAVLVVLNKSLYHRPCNFHSDECPNDGNGRPYYCDSEGENSCLPCFPNDGDGGAGLVNYGDLDVQQANRRYNSECRNPNEWPARCEYCEFGLCSYFDGALQGGPCTLDLSLISTTFPHASWRHAASLRLLHAVWYYWLLVGDLSHFALCTPTLCPFLARRSPTLGRP